MIVNVPFPSNLKFYENSPSYILLDPLQHFYINIPCHRLLYLLTSRVILRSFQLNDYLFIVFLLLSDFLSMIVGIRFRNSEMLIIWFYSIIYNDVLKHIMSYNSIISSTMNEMIPETFEQRVTYVCGSIFYLI